MSEPIRSEVKDFKPENSQILIVDDQQEIIEILSMFLEDEYTITGVSSFDEALKSMEQSTFWLIVVDYHLEGQKGSELLEFCLKNYPHTKRVMITGDKDEKIMVEAINQMKVNRYFHKPFNFQEFKEAIDKLYRDYTDEANFDEEFRKYRKELTNLRKKFYADNQDLYENIFANTPMERDQIIRTINLQIDQLRFEVGVLKSNVKPNTYPMKRKIKDLELFSDELGLFNIDILCQFLMIDIELLVGNYSYAERVQEMVTRRIEMINNNHVMDIFSTLHARYESEILLDMNYDTTVFRDRVLTHIYDLLDLDAADILGDGMATSEIHLLDGVKSIIVVYKGVKMYSKSFDSVEEIQNTLIANLIMAMSDFTNHIFNTDEGISSISHDAGNILTYKADDDLFYSSIVSHDTIKARILIRELSNRTEHIFINSNDETSITNDQIQYLDNVVTSLMST